MQLGHRSVRQQNRYLTLLLFYLSKRKDKVSMHTWTPLFLFSLQVRWSLEPPFLCVDDFLNNANINMCKIFADIVIMRGCLFSTIDNYKQTNWNFRLFFFNKGLINICYVLYWEPSSSEIQNIKLQVKIFFLMLTFISESSLHS